MAKRRVVITGMGAVTPIGNTVAETWQGIKEKKCGIGPITLFDTTDYKVKIAGEVKNLDFEAFIDKKELGKMDRFTQLGVIAAEEAMSDAKFDMEKEDRDRFGVMFSSGIGGLGTIETGFIRGQKRGFDKISPFFIPMAIINMTAAQIAIRYGLNGMCSGPVTACATGTNAVGDAFRQIRDGYMDAFLCGASEAAITALGIGGFTAMRALYLENDPNRASIPFDKERSGFVMGEGAGALVLEEYEHAKSRGAKIYGEVVGYGATCDAYHITAPSPDGVNATKAILLAINDADIPKESVGYINAHGTSTPLNDREETKAIRTAFGAYADDLPVSSTKSYMGHLLGASGAVEAILTTLVLQEGFLPATINYKMPDEECDLDVLPNEHRKKDIEYALSNSLGFGGHNASIIIKKGE